MDEKRNVDTCAPSAGEPCRESARGFIENKICRLRKEAQDLEKLLEALPAKLPREADEALWREFCRSPAWR